MKYLIILLLTCSFSYCFAANKKSSDSVSKKIENLDDELKSTKKELFDRTITSYQQTNDRLNNYISFTGVIATVFGVIIAFGSIWVGFESVKSSRKRDESIKILEEAKKYVEEKKSDFDSAIQEKLKEIEIDYKNLIDISKERLIADISNETLILKELTEKKTLEIEGFSIQEKKDKAFESLQKRIEFFENISIPDDPKILLSKAKLLREKQMPDEAIELLLKVIEKEPQNGDAFWELGWNYAKINENTKAVENYRKSISIKDNATSHNNIGAIYMETTPYDALKEFELAIQLEPKNKLYYRNKGKTLIILKSVGPAIEFYKSIIELDKLDITSYNELIALFKSQNKNDEALDYYDIAILNVPDKAVEINYSKALFLNKIHRKAEAFILFQNLMSLNYKTEECLQVMAQIKIDLGEDAEALKLITLINELNIKTPLAYILRAQILINQDPSLAMDVIKEGIEHIDSNTFNYGYLLHSAKIFAKNKSRDLATELYSKAIPLIEEKLAGHKEADILNCYETYVFLDNYVKANALIKDYNSFIITPKFKLLSEFISLCIAVIEDKGLDLVSQVEKFKNLKNEVKESFYWSFVEMECYLDSKLVAKKSKSIKLLIKFLDNGISYEELQTKIE